MGLLSDLLLLPITGPARGLLFIVEQIKEQVDEELMGETSRIEDALMTLGTRYELGEITEEEYSAQEEALLEQLNEIHQEQDSWLQSEDMEREADGAASEDSTVSDDYEERPEHR